jgi:hypothetical protein
MTAPLRVTRKRQAVPDQPGWHGYGQSLIVLRSGETAARVKSDLGNDIIYADLPVPEKPRGFPAR